MSFYPIKAFFSVFDIVGKEVVTIASEKQKAGECTLNLNTTELRRGIYFVKMSINGIMETQLLIVE